MSAPLNANEAVLLVARREFVTQVRSRSFAIGLVVTLALFGIGGFVGYLVSAANSSVSLGLTPATAALRPVLEETARIQDLELDIREVDDAAGRAQVDGDDIDGLLNRSAGGYELLGRDTVDSSLQALVATAVQQHALNSALAGAGVDPAALAARSTVTTSTIVPVDPNRGERLGVAIIGTILLFMSLNYASVVASGVVEEKQSRVVELLLATINPWQLLAGKVLGLGAVGLLNLIVLGGIGAAVAAAFGLLAVPASAAGMFAMVVLWYVLGFFLFAALYAAVASTVSRQEELQTVLAPMFFVLIVPFILAMNLLPNDPRNTIVTVMSYVPFFSQTVMPARYALGVAAPWEVAVAAVLAVLAIAAVVRVAGRIYQNSVLRTGARVKLRDALATSSS